MHFDPRKAKLLKAGEHMLVEGCPGLRLEVSTSRQMWPPGRICRDSAGVNVRILQSPSSSKNRL